MKNRPYYEKLFEAYPDVVTLPEFREMLGGIVQNSPPVQVFLVYHKTIDSIKRE